MSAHTIKNTPQRSSPALPENNKRRERKIPKKITESYLHNSGLYYLQRFASSRQNFISVMERKIKKSCFEHKEQDFETLKMLLGTLADKFEGCGLLNDDLYIDGMIQSLRRRGLSRSGILQKLAMKGIKRDAAILKLQTQEEAQDPDISPEFEAALKFARRKKIGPYSTKESDDGKQKFFATFARAGYSYDIARKILNANLDDHY